MKRKVALPHPNTRVLWDELLQVSRLGIGPRWHNKTLISLDYRCEFEPWGRASENWDGVYILTFPTIRNCRKTSAGYVVITGAVKSGALLHFRGESVVAVLRKAIAFFHELAAQEIPIPFIDDIDALNANP